MYIYKIPGVICDEIRKKHNRLINLCIFLLIVLITMYSKEEDTLDREDDTILILVIIF